MATKTDFDGFTLNDEGNLQTELSRWGAGLVGDKLPARVRGTWKPLGMASEETIAEIPIAARPDGVMLCDELRKQITAKLGPVPAGGTMRVRGYANGDGPQPSLDKSRTLVASRDETSDPNIALVISQLDRERSHSSQLAQRLVEMAGHMVAMNAASATLAAEAVKHQATLATARTATTAGSDMSSLIAIGAVGLFVWFAPVINQRLGLRPDAKLTDTLGAIRRQGIGMIEPEAPPPNPPGSAPAPAPKLLEQGDPEPVGRLIERLLTDDAFAAEVGKHLSTHLEQVEPLQDRLKEATARAALNP